MAKTKTATPLEQQEEICALRFQQIEDRLESGSKRFVRLDQMIWGVYALIIPSQIIGSIVL